MFQRNVKFRIEKALLRSPVVLLVGPWQSGKTTLAKMIAQERGYHFVSLDNVTAYLAAQRDPINFIAQLEKPLIVDEVQRIPELFLAIKEDVDKNRTAGRYLLTSSANPLLVPKIADVLTGRTETITLLPFSQGELAGVKEQFIDRVFAGKQPIVPKAHLSRIQVCETIIRGGFPPVQSVNFEDQRAWIDEYLSNSIHKDVTEIARISEPTELYPLLHSLAVRAGNLLNLSEVSRTAHMPTATLHRYAALLRALYLVQLQLSWHANIEKRFLKSPKVYFTDTAILTSLLNLTPETMMHEQVLGNVVENFVIAELTKQLGWSDTKASLFYVRTATGVEVDIVLEDRNKNIVGIEVKSSDTVTSNDFRGLTYLQELAQEKFLHGFVLYLGSQHIPFGKQLSALPLASLWSVAD